MDGSQCIDLLRLFLSEDQFFIVPLKAGCCSIALDAGQIKAINSLKKPHVIFILIQHNPLLGHWIACYAGRGSNYEVFNSLGWDQTALNAVNDALQQINHKSVKIVSNLHRVQSANSSTCGLLCIFYAYHRFVQRKTFTQIMRCFFVGYKCHLNDMLVQRFLATLRSHQPLKYLFIKS